MLTNVTTVLTKSGPPLVAHNAGVCSRQFSTFFNLDQVYYNYSRNILVNNDMKLLIELQLFFGLRVSEALGLTPGSYKGNGMFTVVTLKKNEDRIITIKHNIKELERNYINILPLKDRYTRYYVYRLYKKLGIYKKYNNNTYYSVTHYFRHKIVQHLISEGISLKNITRYMGWRSEKSITYYE